MFKYILSAFAVFSFLACESETPVPQSRHLDSAGITLVESAVPEWHGGPSWTIDPTPILDLTVTGAGPFHEFYRVKILVSQLPGVKHQCARVFRTRLKQPVQLVRTWLSPSVPLARGNAPTRRLFRLGHARVLVR